MWSHKKSRLRAVFFYFQIEWHNAAKSFFCQKAARQSELPEPMISRTE